VYVRTEAETTLVLVVDALGHGAKAAEVAARALEIAEPASLADGVLPIVKALHEGLAGSRGACALVGIVRPGALEVCSVGNVELRANGIDIPFVLTAGVLGSRLVRPRVVQSVIDRDARLVLFSDGVSSRFHLPDFGLLSAKDACGAIFERHRRGHDDASLVVVDVGSK
jgi:hypothetical protein